MNDYASGSGMIQAIPKLTTGNTNLDAVLKGGLPKDRLSLISGRAGTGKTLLALECEYRKALTGEPAVFVTFEGYRDRGPASGDGGGLRMHPRQTEGGIS